MPVDPEHVLEAEDRLGVFAGERAFPKASGSHDEARHASVGHHLFQKPRPRTQVSKPQPPGLSSAASRIRDKVSHRNPSSVEPAPSRRRASSSIAGGFHCRQARTAAARPCPSRLRTAARGVCGRKQRAAWIATLLFSTAISPEFLPCATMGRMNAGFRIPLDERACDVLRTIEATGESAWFVGGCVRDALLGRPAHDFDIATSARWPNVAALARERGWRVVDTGCAHGSIAVVADGLPVETTTYRVESGYSDARRPDSVKFVDDIASDLARRVPCPPACGYRCRTALRPPGCSG